MLGAYSQLCAYCLVSMLLQRTMWYWGSEQVSHLQSPLSCRSNPHERTRAANIILNCHELSKARPYALAMVSRIQLRKEDTFMYTPYSATWQLLSKLRMPAAYHVSFSRS